VGFFSSSNRSGAGPLSGREVRPFVLPSRHAVLGGPLENREDPDGSVRAIGLAMGCFWGAEKLFWRLPGVVSTAVGYQGGTTPNPTYDEVCSGRTGHAETVLVSYDPESLPLEAVLRVFWENHDPTQGDRQGNDVGSQYRSAIFCPTEDSLETARRSAEVYGVELVRAELDPVTTLIESAGEFPFYYAEGNHQQYLFKNPAGYNCHSSTGVPYPEVT
jgi:peptide-methionine (S)-S-oxide reductase